ncbi:MAG: PAS domain S-box protein [Pyrinomonadaceae bacterium]
MDEMTDEANLIFSYFTNKQPELAGQRMATMDRNYATVNMALARLRTHIGVIQKNLFEKQEAAAASLQKFEYLIAAFILLMVSAATLYGHKMAKKLESDTRERERSIEGLRDAEARTSTILNAAADGIITFDEYGIIESANAAVEKIFGYSNKDLIGRSVEMLMILTHREGRGDYFADYLRTGEVEGVTHHEVITKDAWASC